MYKIKLTEMANRMIMSIEANDRNQIIGKIEQLKNGPALLGKPLFGHPQGYRPARTPANGIG